jgi:hypothetical protein
MTSIRGTTIPPPIEQTTCRPKPSWDPFALKSLTSHRQCQQLFSRARHCLIRRFPLPRTPMSTRPTAPDLQNTAHEPVCTTLPRSATYLQSYSHPGHVTVSQRFIVPILVMNCESRAFMPRQRILLVGGTSWRLARQGRPTAIRPTCFMSLPPESVVAPCPANECHPIRNCLHLQMRICQESCQGNRPHDRWLNELV